MAKEKLTTLLTQLTLNSLPPTRSELLTLTPVILDVPDPFPLQLSQMAISDFFLFPQMLSLLPHSFSR